MTNWSDVDVEEFRRSLRAFLAARHPGRPPRDPHERLAHAKAWAATLADNGMAAPAWPRRWGGMELPLGHQLAYHEEITRAKLPAHPSPISFIVAPTILLHGTDAQRERFLAPLLRGDELWCQGFSEPGAGSDLASLQTRAVRRDGHYVVTGQKVWTTGADVADWMFALVRTGSAGSHHDGISYLLVDMRAPSVQVRPLRDITGIAHFSEVFFDGVEVPVVQRVGEEGGGWAIARTSLGHERSTAYIASQLRYRRIVDELIDLARAYGVHQNAVVRQDLARVVTGVRLLGWNGARVLDEVLRRGEPGAAGTVNRLMLATFEQRLHELAVDITGAAGLLAPRDPAAPQRGRWTHGFLRTRASTIGAGTAEMQRNGIAEGTLGLPKEARP